jgi:hypothetical protein
MSDGDGPSPRVLACRLLRVLSDRDRLPGPGEQRLAIIEDLRRHRVVRHQGQSEQDERIEALRALIERLNDPDLTLSDAKELRGQLSDLLEPAGGPAGDDRTGSSPVRVPST